MNEYSKEGTQNFVEEMVHVICLPFKIRWQKGDGKERLKDIASFIQNEGSNIWIKGRGRMPRSQNKHPEINEYQTQAYFHPFVRKFLFDKSGTELMRFHRTDIETIRIKLSHWRDYIPEIILDVNKCELALFQPDIGVLILETQLQNNKRLTLEKAQDLMDQFRRTYPPFFDFNENETQLKSGHCPEYVAINGKEITIGKFQFDTENGVLNTDLKNDYLDCMNTEYSKEVQKVSYPMAAHWQVLLAPFDCTIKLSNANYRIEQLGDDRAPIMSWISVTQPKRISQGDWVRLCFADEQGGNVFPYAKSFLTNFEQDFCYDRYWYKGKAIDSGSNPSRIMNCGYAFSYIGKFDAKTDHPYFSNSENGALATFRDIYVEMGLIAHFQKAALLSSNERLSGMVKRDKHHEIGLPSKKEVANFYDHFVEFTQNFWFDEITPQEQGREIFEMWRKHLRLQEMYNDVRQELKDLVEYTELIEASEEMKESKKLNLRVLQFGIAGLVIAFLSLYAGLAQVAASFKILSLTSLFFGIWKWELRWVLLIVNLLIALGIFWFIYKIIDRRSQHKSKERK
jgi:hypothetical protein